jgi:phosphoribosylamine-glycine ligase
VEWGHIVLLQLLMSIFIKKIINEVMRPTMDGLIAEGSPYLGFLYAL